MTTICDLNLTVTEEKALPIPPYMNVTPSQLAHRAKNVRHNVRHTSVTRPSHVHDQEGAMDAVDQIERERHLPDHRRAGRTCSTIGCGTKIYIVGLAECSRCRRRETNLSVDQRDSGRFAHADGAS